MQAYAATSGYGPVAPRKEHSASTRIKEVLSACPARPKLGPKRNASSSTRLALQTLDANAPERMQTPQKAPSGRMPTVPEVPEGEEQGGAAPLEQPKHARLSGSEESFSTALHVASGTEQVVRTVQGPVAVLCIGILHVRLPFQHSALFICNVWETD
jgi:hypothetical protein